MDNSAAATARPPRRVPATAWLVSVLTAAGAYGVATLAELALIRALRPSEQALTWTSDAVLAITVGVVTYLWQHLRATRATLSVVERDGLVLDTQLSMAAEVQRSLLPVLPADGSAVEWAARLEPAGKIGGDFYDVVALDPRTTAFILGDISGKGVPAAMLLTYTRAVFRTLARETAVPVEIVTRLSEALRRDTGGVLYVTCIVGRIDLETGRLTYVNAGHPPGLVIRPSDVLALDCGGPPAGLLSDARFEQAELGLDAADLAVFVTDGVTEAVGTAVSPAAEQIVTTIRRLGPQPRPQPATQALIELALSGPGPAGITDWQDDRTVLSFRWQARRPGT